MDVRVQWSLGAPDPYSTPTVAMPPCPTGKF